MTKPIAPSEAQALKVIPDLVIEAFNEAIQSNMKGKSAHFAQEAVVQMIERKGIKRKTIFEKGYLDVEQIFAKEGWKVEYDKPGFNETYEATFTFTAKK
jgi:hypothetical protein